jgi:hypothetical protein
MRRIKLSSMSLTICHGFFPILRLKTYYLNAPNVAAIKAPITPSITIAGMEAKAKPTINQTLSQKGMLTPTILTFCSSDIRQVPFVRLNSIRLPKHTSSL